MEELALYIREAVDKKQENVRRRRRRDALRLQLVRVMELIAEFDTFGTRYGFSVWRRSSATVSPAKYTFLTRFCSSYVLDRESQSLHPSFIEFIEGSRLFLECESEKDVQAVHEVKLHFGNFIRKMIKNFPCKLYYVFH